MSENTIQSVLGSDLCVYAGFTVVQHAVFSARVKCDHCGQRVKLALVLRAWIDDLETRRAKKADGLSSVEGIDYDVRLIGAKCAANLPCKRLSRSEQEKVSRIYEEGRAFMVREKREFYRPNVLDNRREREVAAIEALDRAEVYAGLRSLPHPRGYAGKTRLDYSVWLLTEARGASWPVRRAECEIIESFAAAGA